MTTQFPVRRQKGSEMPKKPQWIKTNTMGETGVPAKGGTQRKETGKSGLDKLAARYGK